MHLVRILLDLVTVQFSGLSLGIKTRFAPNPEPVLHTHTHAHTLRVNILTPPSLKALSLLGSRYFGGPNKAQMRHFQKKIHN